MKHFIRLRLPWSLLQPGLLVEAAERSEECVQGQDRVILAAHNGVREKLPKRTIDALNRMRVRLEDITDMDVDINVDFVTPEIAARHWINSHPDQFKAWLVIDKTF
jgi:ABC-type proline/glycine betaine transport system substrate-binding protein